MITAAWSGQVLLFFDNYVEDNNVTILMASSQIMQETEKTVEQTIFTSLKNVRLNVYFCFLQYILFHIFRFYN